MTKTGSTVISIVGARPQFIKLAALARLLRIKYRHKIIHSGQHYHYEMSQTFFDQLRIPRPDMNLNVGSGSHGRQTARILERCEKALLSLKPDLVLVYGDTNTTLAGALAASKLGIPVGHVEAGLRSFRRDMPEEINRVVADHLSDLLFYPTSAARINLRQEGITKGLIRSGDLMYEILDECLPIIARHGRTINAYRVEKDRYVLITLHRAENADNPVRLGKFVAALEQLKMPGLFLVHPRTIKNLKRFKLWNRIKNIGNVILESPQPYIQTLALMLSARAVMTDSGGMQKEAYFLGRPCLTMRPETEWVETVEAGANILVDISPARISRALENLPRVRRRIRYKINDRKPSEVIAAAIGNYLDHK